MELVNFDWRKLDKVWEEKGETKAVLAYVPLKENRLLQEIRPGSQRDRCVHCGEIPDLYRYGPYREKRTFLEWIERRVTWTPWDTYETSFCPCWEPEGGYNDRLEYR